MICYIKIPRKSLQNFAKALYIVSVKCYNNLKYMINFLYNMNAFPKNIFGGSYG